MVSDADDARWSNVERALLAGITHALSNRAASVAAISALIDPGETWTPRLAGMLAAEATNLELLVRGMRLLTTDPTLGAEPIDLGQVVPALVALHAQHPELRDVECVAERAGNVTRVSEPPLAFVRRVLLAIDDAKQDALARGSRVVVRYAGEPVVVVSVEERSR